MRTVREHKDKKVSAFKSGRESSDPRLPMVSESSLHSAKPPLINGMKVIQRTGQSAISHVSPHKQQTSLLCGFRACR